MPSSGTASSKGWERRKRYDEARVSSPHALTHGWRNAANQPPRPMGTSPWTGISLGCPPLAAILSEPALAGLGGIGVQFLFPIQRIDGVDPVREGVLDA